MASNIMIHYKVSLYPEQAEALEELQRSLSKSVPTNRLFRESLLAVMSDEELLSRVINNCRKKQYRRHGKNSNADAIIEKFQKELRRYG